jgi:hypothetical protein
MTRLVLLNPQSFALEVGSIKGVDLSSYSATDYISVACPDFTANIDTENSYLDLSSDPDGEFGAGTIGSVSFDQSTGSLTPGDVELRFPLSLFNNVDLSYVTGVRFRLNVTSDDDFKVMSVRCISTAWEYPPIDLNTVSECIELPVSPTGDPDYSVAFPTVSEGNTATRPNAWPVLWQRLNPKDLSASAEVYTGTLGGTNTLSLFFRADNISRSELLDFENLTMGDLNGLPPEEGDVSAFEYLSANLVWESGASYMDISNHDGIVHSFDLSLSASTRYQFTVSVNGDKMRLQIHSMLYGRLDELVHDTGFIRSPLFDHRLGAFGWWAELEDGDSLIDNIRPRFANFGDLLTNRYESSTPVMGAQLVETSTPPVHLVDAVGTGPFGGIVNSQLDGTVKVETNGKMKGFQTNYFDVTDWANTLIEFEIYRDEGEYVAYLLSASGNIVEVPMLDAPAGVWQKIRHRTGPKPDPTGAHTLVVSKVTSDNSVWSIRNLSVSSRAISWSARGKSDPWGMAGNQWTPFEDVANTANGGVVFKEPGPIQVKATLRTGDASIQEFSVIPKYAELGRLVWDNETTGAPSHLIDIISDINGLVVDFGASVQYAIDDNRKPIAYHWGFENGWKTGKSARHTFGSPGMHSAVLRVVYADGTVQTAYWRQSLSAA